MINSMIDNSLTPSQIFAVGMTATEVRGSCSRHPHVSPSAFNVDQPTIFNTVCISTLSFTNCLATEEKKYPVRPVVVAKKLNFSLKRRTLLLQRNTI